LWNPFFASGQPFAGNPAYEVFYPLTTLFFLLPFEWAFRLQVIVPCWSGRGHVLVLAHIAPQPPGLAAGLVSWSCGGYFSRPPASWPSCTRPRSFPWPWASRCAWRGTWKHECGWTGSDRRTQCLTARGGEPSTLLMMPLLVFAAMLAERRRVAGRALPSLAASLLLGLALGAVTLIPGLHHTGKTVRALGLPEAMADVWSMPAWRAFELFTPYPLGHVVPGQPGLFWGGFLYSPRVLPFYHSLYPGLVITLLAIFAPVARERFLWPWLALALSARGGPGHNFPVWHLVRRLPLVAQIPFSREVLTAVLLFPGHAGSVWIRLRGVGPARARLWMKRALLKFVALGLLAPVPCGLRANTCPPIFPRADPARLFARVAGGAGFAVAAVVGATPGRVRRALATCACWRPT